MLRFGVLVATLALVLFGVLLIGGQLPESCTSRVVPQGPTVPHAPPDRVHR